MVDLLNPREKRWTRAIRIMNKVIKNVDLDLSNMVIITEIASGNYIFTPFIAGLAGAKKVFAFTKDSHYSTIEKILSDGKNLQDFTGLDNIEIITELTPDIISQTDIITNMGLLRPIDEVFISHMKETAVIPLMYEAWELRESDIDMNACFNKGVPVMGTNECHISLEVFDYCGPLAVKICFEADLEVMGNNIAIYSNDAFGTAIEKCLSDIGASSCCFDEPNNIDLHFLSGADALILAQMNDAKNIFQWESIRSALLQNPSIKIIQFIGIGDISILKEMDIEYYPFRVVGQNRMAFTFSHLGPLPVISLIAGGFKVGEIMARIRLQGNSPARTVEKALENPLCQNIPPRPSNRDF